MDIYDEIDQYKNTNLDIPLNSLVRWMQSDDIEVMGEVADIITYPPYYQRICPALAEYELGEYLMNYYERCLIENPHNERPSVPTCMKQLLMYN